MQEVEKNIKGYIALARDAFDLHPESLLIERAKRLMPIYGAVDQVRDPRGIYGLLPTPDEKILGTEASKRRREERRSQLDIIEFSPTRAELFMRAIDSALTCAFDGFELSRESQAVRLRYQLDNPGSSLMPQKMVGRRIREEYNHNYSRRGVRKFIKRAQDFLRQEFVGEEILGYLETSTIAS